MSLLQRLQRHDPARLLPLVDVVRQPLERERVRARRVLEREHAVIARRLRVSDSVSSKSSTRLAGEPDDHIGRQRDVRHGLAQPADQRRGIPRACAAGASPRAHASIRDCTGRCRCRQTFGEIAQRRDHPRRDVPRMRAGEPDALQPLDPVEPLEQRREVARRIVRRLVVVHDLPEQLDLRGRRMPPPAARRRGSPPPAACARGRACTGTTQNAQNSLQPSMIVT